MISVPHFQFSTLNFSLKDYVRKRAGKNKKILRHAGALQKRGSSEVV